MQNRAFLEKNFQKIFSKNFLKLLKNFFFLKIDFVEMIFGRKKNFKVQKNVAENREKF